MIRKGLPRGWIAGRIPVFPLNLELPPRHLRDAFAFELVVAPIALTKAERSRLPGSHYT